MDGTYTIVFEELDDLRAEQAADEVEELEVATLQSESEEIAEFLRIVSEVTDPQPAFFSGT